MFGFQRKFWLLLFLLVGCQIVSAPAHANIKLTPLFSDGMVLQRDKPIRVWGKADPGELIGVKIADHAAVVTAGKDGLWITELKPLPATNRPQELVVHGKNEIVIHNVLIGEVWICAGQSNMELPYKKTDATEADTSDANHADIRFLKLNSNDSKIIPTTNPDIHWIDAKKDEIDALSGVGMLFALDLYRSLNIPIGIIQSAHGGANLEIFVSRKSLDNSNEFRSIGTNSDKSYLLYKQMTEQYDKELIEYEKNGKQGKAPVKPDPPGLKLACSAYDALIRPVVPYSVRGVIWYQGEADVYQSQLKYRRMFALMVQDWRTQFHDATLPFIYVQLPSYGVKQRVPEDSDWALMRETQAICRRIPFTYMVVSIDVIPGKVAGMHAREKRTIANRMAAVALATSYKVSKPYASPIFDSMVMQGNKIRLKFRYADKGLIARSSVVTGFEIAGENKIFTNADAQIDGDSIVVYSPRVPAPHAVRYDWADNPAGNLYSADKLPVAPFRTDDWPRLEQKKGF